MVAAVDRVQDWPEFWEPYVREYYKGFATVGEVAARHGLDEQKLARFVQQRRLDTSLPVVIAGGMGKGDEKDAGDRTPDEWRLLVEDYESGSVPFASYAKEKGVYVKAFKHWIDRVRRERESERRKAAKEARLNPAPAPPPVQTTIAPPPANNQGEGAVTRQPVPPGCPEPSPPGGFKRFSTREKRAVLDTVLASGLTVPVWGDMYGFNSATLYQWFRESGVQPPRSGYGKYARANGGLALPPEQAPKPMPKRKPKVDPHIAHTLMKRAAPAAPAAPAPKPAAPAPKRAAPGIILRPQPPGITLRLGETELTFAEAPSPEYLAQLARALKG